MEMPVTEKEDTVGKIMGSAADTESLRGSKDMDVDVAQASNSVQIHAEFMNSIH